MITKGVKGTKAERAAAAGTKVEKPKSNTRVRLANAAGHTLIFTKKMSKNGAIRVSATLSLKGAKPQKIGRETFVSHEDANKGMDRMVAEAAKRGWTLKVRKTGYAPVDKKIVIPQADAVTFEPLEDEEDAPAAVAATA